MYFFDVFYAINFVQYMMKMCQMEVIHVGRDVVCPAKPVISYFQDNNIPYKYGGEMFFDQMCTADVDSTEDDYADKLSNFLYILMIFY